MIVIGISTFFARFKSVDAKIVERFLVVVVVETEMLGIPATLNSFQNSRGPYTFDAKTLQIILKSFFGGVCVVGVRE